MILKAVPTQKGSRFNLYADDEYIMTVDSSVWYTCGHSDGEEIDSQELTELKTLVGSRLAYSQALRILTLRAHSEKELRDKLAKKHDEESIDFAVQRCYELGFLDDSDFAVRYASELYEKKHFAPSRIRQELRIKGISEDFINIALETLDINPIPCIIDLIESKYADSMSDEKGRRRVIAALQRLGYGWSDIRKAVSNFTTGDEYDEY